MAAKHSGSRQRSDGSHKQPQATAPLPPALHLLHSLDQRLSHALFRRGSRVPRWVWKLFELSGDGLVWLALAIGCALAPGTAPAARHAWAAFLLCWAVDLALVGLIKASIRRSRPVYNLRSDFTVVVAVDHFSFPSGHSSRASFVALFWTVLLGSSRPWLCAAVAVWALATALSRAAMGRHYLSDILAGLAVGFVTVGIATQGQYSPAGLVVTQQHSDEAYVRVQRWLASAAVTWRSMQL